MKISRASIVGIAVASLFCLAGAVLWLKLELDKALAANLDLSEPILYEIRAGQSLAGVMRDLTAMQILKRPAFLVWHARLNGAASMIKAGEYRLTPELNAAQMLEMFVAGRVFQRAFTIVEGWTFGELLDAVRSAPTLEITLKNVPREKVMEAIGFPDTHPEGRFLPDTYHFPKGTTDAQFLIRAYKAMREHLDKAWQRRDAGLPFDTPYEALVLASIVEKETAVPEERELIAGVFVERLRRGMRLQTDPTVIYGIGAAFDGNLRKRDLERDTPYNTYTRKGLPPTPIANPGTASINAVMHPKVNGLLYFVAKGDGSHHFSATYEEHAQAVTRYQLKGRARGNNRGG